MTLADVQSDFAETAGSTSPALYDLHELSPVSSLLDAAPVFRFRCTFGGHSL